MQEKGNRKKRSQKSNKHQKPIAKKQRTATVVITPDAYSKSDTDTGNVSDLEMYYHLNALARHFARQVCLDAKDAVGDSSEDQIKYLDWRIEQSGINS